MTRNIAGLCCLFLTVKLFSSAVPQGVKRPITDKDLFAFNWVANAQVSPDGTRVAFVRVTVDEKRTGYNTSIWVVAIDGSAEPTRLTAGTQDQSPRWSPDGKQLAFLRSVEKDGKPEPPQLYILQMTGGEPWPITRLPKGAKSPAWSPSGKAILFNSRTNTEDLRLEETKKKGLDEHESDVRIITRAIYRFDNEGYADDKHPEHIWTVAVPSSPEQNVEPKQLTTGPFDEHNARWSPDGSRIYFSSVRVSEPYYDPDVLTIYWIASAGGEIHKVTSMAATFGAMAISPDGRQIAIEAAPSKPVLFYSENHSYVVSADGGIPRLIPTFDHEIGSGNCSTILGDMEPPRGEEGFSPIWQPDGSAVYERVSIGGTNNVMRFEIPGGQVIPFTTGNHNIFEIAADPQVSHIVAILSTPDSLLDLYNISSPAHPIRLTHFNDQLFSQLEISEPEDIKYKSFDGKEIEAWVYRPPDFDPHKKYPLILNIHGGPMCAYGFTFFHEFQWMAAKGYVVLAPNQRGSSNYGQGFGNITQYKYPGDDYKDLMAGVDELLRRGYIDEKRLGVTGGSGGGILTNWAITRTNRFAAAVSQRDVADMAGFWYTSDRRAFIFVPSWFRGAPWQDPQDFAARSPITHVASVKTPLMLILGEDDFIAPPGAGGEQMFRALKFLRVPTVMIRFPGESHELSRSGQPWHRVERLENILNWFDKYLSGKPMPQYDVPSDQSTATSEQTGH